MRPIISTGLENFIASGGSIRKAFDNCILCLYEGVGLTTADAAIPDPAGDLLCKITLNNGTVVGTDVCTPTIYRILIGSHVAETTFKFDLTVDDVGPETYTYTASSTAHTLDQVCLGIAEMLDAIPQLSAISSGNDDGIILVKSYINGLDFTLAISASPGNGIITSVTKKATAARPYTLQFGPPTSGVISKYTDDIWSGLNLKTGIAGYFRFCLPDDDFEQSATEFRAQGTISTSGDDLNLSNINLKAGLTTVIGSYDLELPKSQ